MIRITAWLLLATSVLGDSTPVQSISTQIPPNDKSAIEHQNTTDTNNIEKILKNQIDSIKDIVHDQVRADYPVITKKEPQWNIDDIPINEYKIKCQQLSKLLDSNQTTINRLFNGKQPNLQTSNRATLKPSYGTVKPSKPHGFYITNQPVRTPRPAEAQPQLSSPVNYQLEPVILQKTTLDDGRTVYYWLRSLPAGLAPTLRPYGFPINTAAQPYGYAPPDNQLHQAERKIAEVKTPPVTTSKPASAGFSFIDLLPFYSFRGREETTSTTTTTTTTEPSTTTTTPSSTTTPKLAPENQFYTRLKFVVPLPYKGSNDVSTGQAWDFDPYAYYPRDLQPNFVNVKVPYSPTFHVIRSVTIPKDEVKVSDHN